MTEKISVVITTFNRPILLKRAVKSMLEANDLIDDIIIVDDCSELPLPHFPSEKVRVTINPSNSGPNYGRMRGLQMAKNDWVMIFDDDDYLISNITKTIRTAIDKEDYASVVQFSISNSVICEPRIDVDLDSYLSNKISGDFIQIINRHRFQERGYKFPELKVGGEHLLWWEIASHEKIPTYSTRICTLGDESDSRLTHISSQLKHAELHAKLAKLTLDKFGCKMAENYPHLYQKTALGLTTYLLLAGQKRAARAQLTKFDIPMKIKTVLYALSFAPRVIIRHAFIAFRKKQGLSE